MYGPPNSSTSGGKAGLRDAEFMGLIPRAVNEIFDLNARSRGETIDFKVYCSFVQIYNENLFDMLRDSSMVSPLSIREDKKEIYVQGLSEYHVQSVADTLQLLKIAEENRAIRETHMNQFSSRSHSIFQIYVEQKRLAEDGGEISYRAKFNLVDLAGSEKWNTKTHMRDAHIAEMTNINLSLHTLGKCISSLAQISILKEKEAAQREREHLKSQSSLDKSTSFLTLPPSGSATPSKSGTANTRPSTVQTSGSIHVPYRDSKLTRLLQDSLGGNARTFLIATVSPARINTEESISTLKFADRAKQVMVSAIVNETRPVDHALVKRLQQEVETLKVLLKKLMDQSASSAANGGGGGVSGISQSTNSLQLSASYSNLFNGGAVPNLSHSTTPQKLSKNNSSFNNSRDDFNSQNALERALNKEQTHSQHLTQKNETLIRELEELRESHSYLIQPTEASLILTTCTALTSQNDSLWTLVEGVQSVMKKFFKYLIEEDDMREKISASFDRLKDLKVAKQTQQGDVDSSVRLLELVARHKGSGGGGGGNNGESGSAGGGMTYAAQQNTVLPSMRQSQEHSLSHNQSLPQLSSSSQSNKQQHNHRYSDQDQTVFEHINNHNTNMLSHSQSVKNHHTASTNSTQQNPVTSSNQIGHNNSNSNNNISNAVNGIPSLSFRVRGSASGSAVSNTNNNSNNNNTHPGSVRSSSNNNWLQQSEEQEGEEERLERELKKAKKKAKKDQKLQQWTKEKEDRAAQELRLVEEEKRAMKDA
eukprot:gene22428-28553_t